MKKQLFIVLIFVILLVVSLTGCFEENKKNESSNQNTTDESDFIGKWVVIDDLSNSSIGNVYTFFENRTLQIIRAAFQNDEESADFYNFKVENNRLCINTFSWQCFEYEFFNENSFVIFMSGAMTLEKFDGYSSTPLIEFDVDSANSSLIVSRINQTDIYWSDFEIIGNATTPSGKIDVGDTITNCTGNILIRHISSNTFQGVWVV